MFSWFDSLVSCSLCHVIPFDLLMDVSMVYHPLLLASPKLGWIHVNTHTHKSFAVPTATATSSYRWGTQLNASNEWKKQRIFCWISRSVAWVLKKGNEIYHDPNKINGYRSHWRSFGLAHSRPIMTRQCMKQLFGSEEALKLLLCQLDRIILNTVIRRRGRTALYLYCKISRHFGFPHDLLWDSIRHLALVKCLFVAIIPILSRYASDAGRFPWAHHWSSPCVF